MVLGGVGMLGYVVLWAMAELAKTVGWPETRKVSIQAFVGISFIVGGLVLIVFGLGLK